MDTEDDLDATYTFTVALALNPTVSVSVAVTVEDCGSGEGILDASLSPVVCVECPEGTSAPAASSRCEPCMPGTYANTKGERTERGGGLVDDAVVARVLRLCAEGGDEGVVGGLRSWYDAVANQGWSILLVSCKRDSVFDLCACVRVCGMPVSCHSHAVAPRTPCSVQASPPALRANRERQRRSGACPPPAPGALTRPTPTSTEPIARIVRSRSPTATRARSPRYAGACGIVRVIVHSVRDSACDCVRNSACDV